MKLGVHLVNLTPPSGPAPIGPTLSAVGRADPAHLARSLGALGSLDVEQGLAVTLPQVLRSAKTWLDADRAALMLIDHLPPQPHGPPTGCGQPGASAGG
jgi:hypothetical protein